ncbi:E3 ubiquitin-protein ligase PPP1R11 isoform X2 [Agrilus planipennis]|uniref:E3 ubiquitin-protein ligase PPP1R11 n=1 Tax=Agrilus planipennis TaxID=224129 RepID=A0A1W4W9P0_AGRPL|nr:E3 ubiquitin-protein ligase PPP1R11 isoform X2 [Agrilus planipennis]
MENDEVPTLKLRLVKPKSDRKVKWTSETVDNEDLNKKKSKCCCIYTKPKVFGESSSSDSSDDECDHCKGHTDKKKKKVHHHCDPNAESCELPRAAVTSNAAHVNDKVDSSDNVNPNPDSNLNQ